MSHEFILIFLLKFEITGFLPSFFYFCVLTHMLKTLVSCDINIIICSLSVNQYNKTNAISNNMVTDIV